MESDSISIKTLLGRQAIESVSYTHLDVYKRQVLICSNIVISLLAKIIPDKVRIPCYIVVIAGFVTLVQFALQAFVPALYSSLGLFIPLIVVNCIILGRAEMFASKNNPLDSALDGIGMGLGFTLALGVMGAIREILGAGTIFGVALPWLSAHPMMIIAPVSYTHLLRRIGETWDNIY